MSDIIEKLTNQIDIDKEVLSVLPRNNKKNLKAYKEKAEEIKQEYANYLSNIIAEIKRRMVKITSIITNPKIQELSNELSEMEKVRLLDDNSTPFEKIKLDEMLYILKRFYKNNLEVVNSSIINCIDAFKVCGIDLDIKDFNYSIFTKEYMQVFLEEMKKGESNSAKVKEVFEQIYWKCSDIIMHIELNFRSLYLKYEKTISNHLDDEKRNFLKEQSLEPNEALEKFNSINTRLQDLMNRDTFLILEDFKNGEKNPKDFEANNVQKYYKKLTDHSYDELEKDVLNEFNYNIEKLYNSLNEYKNFQRFKFIYDEIIAIYNDKQKYNKVYQDKLKKIQKQEIKLFKQNKKIEKYSNHKSLISKLFSKSQKKLDKINIDINTQILELKQNYRDLEESKIKSAITEKLTDSSTVYDALKLASMFYSFLVKIIIKQYEDISQEDIVKMINDFDKFVYYSNLTIINNIKITDNKDIAMIIKDKYNLCNINIEKGDFDEDNIDSLIVTAGNICEYNYILNSKITLDDIKFVISAKKILESI